MARPDLDDYIVFFETEPEWITAAGWYYGARFTTTRGPDRIVATIAPDELELSIDWWQGDVLKLRFRSTAVRDWLIETKDGREYLFVHYLEDERVKCCLLQLRPHVFIEWQMGW